MSEEKDLLSADTSPDQLNSAGVKRVNNRPLLIGMGIVTVFVLLIVMVTVKRANAQNHVASFVNTRETAGQSSIRLAKEVVGNQSAGIIPSTVQTIQSTQTVSLPVAIVDDPDSPPKPYQDERIPDAEIERIRQDKTQQFEEAVKARTLIALDKDSLGAPAKEGISERELISPSLPSQESLVVLQAGQPDRNALPKTLGGSENEARWALNASLSNPSTPYELRTGSVIPGVMISGVRSELPGQIIGQVSQPVYDTATGRHLLIPQGTKLFGLYSSEVAYGQDTLLVAWQRLTFPDGRVLDIGSMPGTDSAGMAGFRDQVDHHYLRIFGSAMLMSGIVGGITYSQSQNQANNGAYSQPTAGSILSQALGQQLGEVTAQLIAKNLNIAPDIKIGSGYEFNIIVTKDLVFEKPYRVFDY